MLAAIPYHTFPDLLKIGGFQLRTFGLMVVINALNGFRMPRTLEIEGMDLGIHGEQGWMLTDIPLPTVGLPGDQSVDWKGASDQRPAGVRRVESADL